MAESNAAPVSVVIPCYRCSDTIERAVASVYAQTWRPAEVILVEDCSGDGTLSRLFELKEKYPVDWIQVIGLSVNDGPGTARNVGWENATQTYIAFLDADDAWHPQKVSIQARWMLDNSSAALTGHACVVVKAEKDVDTVPSRLKKAEFKLVRPRQLLLSNRFPTRTVMLRRDLPHRFAYGKRYIEDFLLWSEICLDGYSCFLSESDLAYLFKADYGEGGLSGDLWKMEKGELDAYKRLWFSGRIKLTSCLFFSFISYLKYFRRFILIRIKA